MSKQILINSTPQETRIALLDEDRVMELFIERATDKGIVGNIYKAKVLRVLPGMQAAFVDIGQERAAFLYAGDILPNPKNKDGGDDNDEDNQKRGGRNRGRRRRPSAEDVPPIAELIKEGQEVLVQVAKGPIGTKGARVTCHLSLPGRFVVFMPNLTHNGVSRKIEDYDHRKKLKKMIDQYKLKEGGFIVRTAAGSDSAQERQIKHDVDYLKNVWAKIRRKFNKHGAPKLLHYDLDLTTRTIRDHLDDDIEFMIVDSKHEHKKILRFIRNFNPELKNKVEFYQDSIPLFDRFSVENEINKAMGKRVWLKSGGYLIIENTEALTSVDVNTGRFVGKKNLEETILKTNLEAAEELVRQLRLRNIGGIIIVDFIDMERESSKDQVYRFLDSLVREDRQKTTILRISNLGLVEMTRKRARTPLHRYLGENCPTCDGKGFIKSPLTVATQTLREIKRELPFCEDDHLHVSVHPQIYEILTKYENKTIVDLEKQHQRGVKLHSSVDFNIEQIGISPLNSPKLKGAKLAPLPFMQKVSLPDDFATDEDDHYDDSAEYEADVKEIQNYRDEQMKRVQQAAERARKEESKSQNESPQPSEQASPSDSAEAEEEEFESPVIREKNEDSSTRDEDDEENEKDASGYAEKI